MQQERAPRISGLVLAAAFVVVVAGLKAAVAIVTPFLLALFVAVICAPALLALQERRVPTGVALLLVVAGVGTVFLLLGYLLGSSVAGFSARLPVYQARLAEIADAVADQLAGLGAPGAVAALRERIDAGAALQLVGNLVSGLGGLLTNSLFVLLCAVFMLLEAASFREKVAAVVPDPEASLGQMDQILAHVRGYLAVKTATSLLTGVLVALLLVLLGVDFPLLWGLLAFLLNYVPNLGSILAALPGVLVALVQLGWGTAGLAAGGYLLVNFAVGNALEPRLMGRSAGLSTLVAFVSLVFWGWVLGPVGMLLSVPLTVTAKIALESHADTRWIAVLLGPSHPRPAGKSVARS